MDKLDVETGYEEKDIEDLRESIYIIIDDFVKKNVLEYRFKDFEARIFEHTNEIVEQLHSEVLDIFNNLIIADFIREGIYLYFSMLAPPRSFPDCHARPVKSQRDMGKHIQFLYSKNQPAQQSPAWYAFRREHITASSAWRALASTKNQNQLIYSKCAPLDRQKYSRVNIKSATHHGHRYEQVSILFYEDMYNTEIGELGCLEHDSHPCIAASPDGINIKRNNPRYGRLIEVKNPVSRKLTGIPKKEYWIQMQMQMFVTGIRDCDFLETVFKEYGSVADFDLDGTFVKTAQGRPKGIIVCFFDGRKPVYKYSPWKISREKYEIWYETLLSEENGLTWTQNVYWYLETYSCITVPANDAWMKAALPHFKVLWKTVLKERVEGFSHRKPAKRIKKPPIPTKGDEPTAAVDNIIITVNTETFESM